jgi:hypothetical protein
MFVTIHKYCNNFGEVATHSVLWHVNYENVVKRANRIVKEYVPSIQDTIGKPFTVQDLWQAKEELEESFNDTLTLGVGNNPRDTSSHSYDKILSKNGHFVPGVKLHRGNDEIHLTGLFRIKKVVHCPVEYPGPSSSPVVLAKRWLRGRTPLIKWGQYVLSPGRFDTMVAEYQTLVEQDFVRNIGRL